MYMKVSILRRTAILLILAVTFSNCSERTDKPEETELFADEPEETDLFADEPEETDLSTDDLNVKYMKMWKELFVQRNNLPENYFCQHIELATSSIDDWNDGTSFSICYSVKIDWAIAYNCDHFIININNNLYPTLHVPRNVYLEMRDIEKVVNMRAFSSDILKLTSDEKLKFKSLEEAMDYAIKQTYVNTLRVTATGVFIDRETGHICLQAVESHEEINKCIFVTLDLISGQIRIDESVCYIF